MSNNKTVRRVAIIGTGVIGASWTALFLAKGLEVIATDVAADGLGVGHVISPMRLLDFGVGDAGEIALRVQEIAFA